MGGYEIGWKMEEWGEYMISVSSSIDLAIFIPLIGIALYYFGKMVSASQVQINLNEYQTYCNGLFFCVGYVIIPIVIIYYIKDFLPMFSGFYGILPFIIHVTVYDLLYRNIYANEFLKRYGLLDFHMKKYMEKMNQIQKIDFIKQYTQDIDNYKMGRKIVYDIPLKIGKPQFLFILSLFTFSSLYAHYLLGLPFFILSLIFSFVNITFIAIIFGFNNIEYPMVKLYIEGKNEPIEAKMIETRDFIFLLKEKTKIFVNKNKVVYFEENLLKNNANGMDKNDKNKGETNEK